MSEEVGGVPVIGTSCHQTQLLDVLEDDGDRAVLWARAPLPACGFSCAPGPDGQRPGQRHQDAYAVSVRLLVLHNLLNYSRTSIVVQQEVIGVGGNKVNRSEIVEVKLTVNKHMEILQVSSLKMSLEDSYLYSIPWDNDVLFTFPNIPESGDNLPQQTTREYSIGLNTTVDEEPFPGKLPETPIRAVIPASSYKVMCEFADELREKLCLIWSWLYPILVDIAQVLIAGVIGAAVVLEVLKIFYPLKEPKWILQSSTLKDSPMFVPLILGSSDTKEEAQETGSIS
ncbi:hypothetical protein GDO81_008258 [Engystomops pustulosus]|uniref:Glycoprotein integral membrane protein 1 n=1 Tax=Engystomops pustulosus TaxID=76066 RepID=A0AAV7CED7_ENGPU|nr:hypothetical protein GDO81_008258 [Engystomops pustulosus]